MYVQIVIKLVIKPNITTCISVIKKCVFTLGVHDNLKSPYTIKQCGIVDYTFIPNTLGYFNILNSGDVTLFSFFTTKFKVLITLATRYSSYYGNNCYFYAFKLK